MKNKSAIIALIILLVCEEENMELGKNIIKIRKQNNLTQDDFAEKYFVTRQTVSNWENSKSYPDLETIIKISDDFKGG